MSTTSRCSETPLLRADFDFASYTTHPADVAPLHNMDLQELNVKNVRIQAANSASIIQTRAYEAAAGTTAGVGVGARDVGMPLEPFFAYTDEQKNLLVVSQHLVDAVGPLPIHITIHVAQERAKTAALEAIDKAKREKEHVEKEAEKAKASQPIYGTLVMTNPHPISTSLKAAVVFPPIFVMSLHHKIFFPLHWWEDKILREGVEFSHSVPKESTHAGQTSSLVVSEKVLVVDVTKASTKWLSDEAHWPTSNPSLWRQAAGNLLEALKLLCPKYDPANPVHTYYTEFKLHITFFLHLEIFDTLFHVWYPAERLLRHKIFTDGLFNQNVYEHKIEVAATMYEQTRALGIAFSAPAGPSTSFTPGSKHHGGGDQNPAPPKQQRTDSRHDFRGEGNPSRESSSHRAPSCIACVGPHPLREHQSTSTIFEDKTPHFSKPDGNGGLRTVENLRGNQCKHLCMLYSLSRPCTGLHPDGERLHICSLCGGDHAALSRDKSCKRVRAGALVP
ncbi:hypothetical protein C8R44DRAFT_741862 [Mycena epipterygia]|nr:hypothetical protein C8R44DRAFT_741862 [Mycena epipterygia]